MMNRVSRKFAFLSVTLVATALGLGGCKVNQDTYDNLRSGFDVQKARNVELLDENASLRASLEDLRSRIGSGSDAAREAMELNARLQAELDASRRRLGDLDARLASINLQPLTLDAATDSALADLARQFPDILSYDSKRGMLRFTSDVTFASGSFQLTSAGREVVRRFGQIILSTPAAQQYDIKVQGHTDTQPVTIRGDRQFRDNAELSAFRAIAVWREMIASGIDPHRAEFSGAGETRPLVQNSSNGNTPQNRRVEVYLTRGNYEGLTARPVQSRQGAPRSTTPAVPGAARPAGSTTPAGGTSTPTGSDLEITR